MPKKCFSRGSGSQFGRGEDRIFRTKLLFNCNLLEMKGLRKRGLQLDDRAKANTQEAQKVISAFFSESLNR